MGHRHTSATLGGHGRFWRAVPRPARLDRPRHFAEERAGLPRTRGLSAHLLLFLVRLYQVLLSPFFGGACKFHPSCSNYAYEAVARWGARRGAWLALKRLGRCRPFSAGGFDPVPEVLDAPAGEEPA